MLDYRLRSAKVCSASRTCRFPPGGGSGDRVSSEMGAWWQAVVGLTSSGSHIESGVYSFPAFADGK
jgi:hypothetical protein